MKHFKHKLLFALLAVFSFTCHTQAQVTIGDDALPRLGTVLDLKQTNPAGTMGGLLLPTVNITDVELIPDDFIGYEAASEGVRDQVLELAGTLVYNVNATTGEGIYYWDGNKWCKFSVNVPGDPTGDPADIDVGTGSFTGKFCFDIAKSNDNANGCATLASRIVQRSDFSLTTVQDPDMGNLIAPYTAKQVYTFTPSGTVSKVRFDYVDVSGKVIETINPNADYTGNNISTACKVTAIYKTSLNDSLVGLTRTNALKVDLYAIYNDAADGTGVELAVKLTAALADCTCCGAYIAADKWQAFMCHNLGADERLDPFTPAKGLHGNYYQWGRSTAVANADTPPEAISGWNAADVGDNLWTDATKTANDPCPPHFRIPRRSDWQNVLAQSALNPPLNPLTSIPQVTWENSPTNFNNGKMIGPNLFLPTSGIRTSGIGALQTRALTGAYWSSTAYIGIGSNHANFLGFKYTQISTYNTWRSEAQPIRCVAEQ